jgi:hypothetical protein
MGCLYAKSHAKKRFIDFCAPDWHKYRREPLGRAGARLHTLAGYEAADILDILYLNEKLSISDIPFKTAWQPYNYWPI